MNNHGPNKPFTLFANLIHNAFTFSASPVLGIASVRDAEETPAQDEDAEDAPLSGMSRTMRSSSKAATAAMIASAMAEEEDQVQ